MRRERDDATHAGERATNTSRHPVVRLYNTFTRRIEAFEPPRPPHVAMYSCGPTVYRYVHIGNLRTYLMA
ncbi:MAG: hypothetical protein ACRDHE_08220, partial [Ktedonobacterales bacterium]